MAEIVALIMHELLNTATPVEIVAEHMSNLVSKNVTKEVL